ncbi:hypothetical protein PENTCL1PPCAC_1421, partial [Pristionchus entomophagus]
TICFINAYIPPPYTPPLTFRLPSINTIIVDMEDHMINWLRFYPCQNNFINSYHYALLSENLDKAEFKLPLFILTEELINEARMNTESSAIREYIHQLLQTVENRKLSDAQYEQALREFLSRPKTMPEGVGNPLINNNKFFTLATSCKLWILVALIQNVKGCNTPNPIGTDSLNNTYYLTEGGRLYIQIACSLEATKKEKESGSRPTTLDLYLAALEERMAWKLLAETEKLWTAVGTILECYEEADISNVVLKERERAKRMMITEDGKSFVRKDFEERLHSFQLARKPRQYEGLSPPSYDELGFNHGTKPSAPRENINPERDFVTNGQPQATDNAPRQVKIRARCRFFPNMCRNGNDCAYIHPKYICRNFRKNNQCKGPWCHFLHRTCRNDGQCTGYDCPYEHYIDEPTLHRIQCKAQNEQPRDNGERQPRGRSATRNADDRRREHSTASTNRGRSNSRGRAQQKPNDPSPKNVRFSADSRRGSEDDEMPTSSDNNERYNVKKDERCKHYPRWCNKPDSKCPYVHPRENCPNLPNCNRGRRCVYLHGECKTDGRCADIDCIYEHYQQRHPRV